MRRYLAILVMIVALAILLSTNVFAADVVDSNNCGYNLSWTLDTDGVLTISGQHEMFDYNATTSPWYKYRDQIKKIEIYPSYSYISIGDYAFYNLTNLRTVELHRGGVSSIGAHAFENCSNLNKMYIWKWSGQLDIGEKAFYNCSRLKETSLPTKCIIGANAFGQCSQLDTIYIGNTEGAFWSISSLSFEVDETAFTGVTSHVYYPKRLSRSVFGGFGGDLTWCAVSHGVCGANSKWNFNEDSGVLTISGVGDIQELITGQGQPWYCFQDDIVEIVVEEGITELPDYCFEYLKNVTTCVLPDSLQSMSASAFNACSSLTDLLVPSSVEKFWTQSWFTRCDSLTDIYYLGTEKEWNDIENNDTITSGNSAISVPITVHFLEEYEQSDLCKPPALIPFYRFDNYYDDCAYPYTYSCNKKIIEDDSIFNHKWNDAKCTEVCICTICGYSEETVRGHDYVGVVTREPSCKEKGLMTYICQNDSTHTYTEEIDTIPHDFDSNIVKFQWGEDYSCVADVYCVNLCGATEQHDCKVSSVTVEGMDCQTKGTITYTAKYLSYSDTKTIEGTAGKCNPGADATCTEDQICTVCKKVLVEASGHTFNSKPSDTVANEANCTEPAKYYVQCDNCNEISEEKAVSVGNAMGHNYDKPYFSWSDDLSSVSAILVCSECDQGVLRGTCELEWTSEVGKLTVTATVTLNDQEYSDKKIITMTVSNGKVIVYLPTAMPDITIFGVGYTSNHAMSICKTEKADKTVVELSVSGEIIKLFFLDKDTFVPVMPCMVRQ